MIDGDDGKLSAEQIKSWRRVLCSTLGPYALIAPDDEIQRIRNTFQNRLDAINVGDEKKGDE